MLIRDHSYTLTFGGLKPYTRHYFYIDKEQVAPNLIKPYGKLCGTPLISDFNGRIILIGYYVTDAFNSTTKEQKRVVDKSRQARQRVSAICDVNATVLTDSLFEQAVSKCLVYL